MALVWGALKYDSSGLGGDGNKGERFADRGLGQLSIEDTLQKFDPAGGLEILWRGDPRAGQSCRLMVLERCAPYANVRHRREP